MANLINAKTSGAGGLETTADNTGNINIQSGGSTVMEVTSAGVAVTGSLTQNGGAYSTQPTFRNRIINGNMAINQRGSASYDITGAVYTLDRYRGSASISSKFSIAPGTTTPPAGFTNYLQVTSSAATTPGSTDNYSFFQRVEGYNVADLNWGTSDAQTVTMSFWVRSTLTGTFGGKLQNSAQNRIYIFSYTISSANTWEKKTITVTGDTTGTWLTTTGVGLAINFSVGAGSGAEATAGSWGTDNVPYQPTGSTNVVATSGATWQITGLQLEAGTTATDFENLQYGQQMQLCQRYFYSLGGTVSYEFMTHGMYVGTTTPLLRAELPVKMRAAPTLGSTGTFLAKSGNSNLACASFSVDQAATQTFSFSATISGGSSTAGYATLMFANASTATRLTFSAEL